MSDTPLTDAESFFVELTIGGRRRVVSAESFRKLERALAALEQEMKELTKENEFLHDLLNAFEWQRINSMHIDEVKKELLENGYRLDAGLAKIKATIEKYASSHTPTPTTPPGGTAGRR